MSVDSTDGRLIIYSVNNSGPRTELWLQIGKRRRNI